MLSALIAALAVYAFKDWYKSLCGLILLLAVVEHPDFPKTMMGVQGLNPWNILLAVVLIAWARGRKVENLQWDMPKGMNWLLAIYFSIIFISVGRFIGQPAAYIEFSLLIQEEMPGTFSIASEYIINSVKWVIPGILLFDGCRWNGFFSLFPSLRAPPIPLLPFL